MKKVILYLSATVLLLALIYFALGYFSSYIGWHGYEKWKHRSASQSIEESKKRGVFIKACHYRIEGFSEKLDGFEPFIEKGFKYGYRSSEETRQLTNTGYPYQLSFNYRPNQAVTVSIREDQLTKFDSANNSWGYLKVPQLPDTIILTIGGENIKPAIIKVW